MELLLEMGREMEESFFQRLKRLETDTKNKNPYFIGAPHESDSLRLTMAP